MVSLLLKLDLVEKRSQYKDVQHFRTDLRPLEPCFVDAVSSINPRPRRSEDPYCL